MRQQSAEPFDAIAALELLAGEMPARIESLTMTRKREDIATPRRPQRVSELTTHIRDRFDRLEKREANLSALVDAARDFARPTDLDNLLRAIIRRARVLLSTDIAYLSLHDFPDEPACVRASDGHVSSLMGELQVPYGAGLGGAVQANLSPFWTQDYLVDDRFTHDETLDKVIRAEGLRAILAVPMSYESPSSGVLYVGSRSVRHFTREEIALLSSLGELAGVAVEQALALDLARRAVNDLTLRLETLRQQHHGCEEVDETNDWLTDLVVTGVDPQMLAAAARGRLGGAVRVDHGNGAVLATAGTLVEPSASVAASASMRAHVTRGPVHLADNLWAAGIRAGAESLGTLLWQCEATPTVQQRRLLDVFARAFSLLLAQPGKSVPAPCEARNELLGDLLAATQISPQQMRKRAARIGVDLSAAHVLIVIRPDGEPQGDTAVWASRYSHRRDGLMNIYDGRTVLLLPGEDPRACAQAVWEELQPLLGRQVTISAAGPIADPGSVYHSYQEAARCLDAMTALGLAGRHGSVQDLGFFGMLLSDNHDVDSFLEQTIGSVLDYDQQRPGELFRTLDAYFETGGSPTHAARRLHVHTNTVARRLERICELLGADWQQPEKALQIQLALRLARIRGLLKPRRDTVDADEAASDVRRSA